MHLKLMQASLKPPRTLCFLGHFSQAIRRKRKNKLILNESRRHLYFQTTINEPVKQRAMVTALKPSTVGKHHSTLKKSMGTITYKNKLNTKTEGLVNL